jgi:hypothetical protein
MSPSMPARKFRRQTLADPDPASARRRSCCIQSLGAYRSPLRHSASVIPGRARRWFVAVMLFGPPACGITDASDASRVDGPVVNIFSETPLGDVGVNLVESGELVASDRTIASTRTAADGTFSITYESKGVRCSSLLLHFVRDGYLLAANPHLGSVRIAGCETRAHRAGMAPRPQRVPLSLIGSRRS